MKIDGKNCLTLSHTLSLLGSKNDTTAKYKEGFKNFFGTLHRRLNLRIVYEHRGLLSIESIFVHCKKSTRAIGWKRSHDYSLCVDTAQSEAARPLSVFKISR